MAQTRDFVLGLFVGAAVGAAVAILYAPQSGPETRDYLRQKGSEFKDKTSAAVDTAKQRARDVAGNVGTSAQQIVDTARSKVEAQVSAVQAAVDAGRQAFQDKRSELDQEVSEDLGGSTSTGATPA
jgi:gas vesicle protein